MSQPHTPEELEALRARGDLERRSRFRVSSRPRKGGGMASIRGYQMTPRGTTRDALKIVNLFSALYPDHPSAFKWKKTNGTADMGRLGRFIDAIYLGNVDVVNAAQEEGYAFDLEYDQPTTTPQEHVFVRLPQLLSIMSLKGEVPLPLWGRISFLTDGRSLVPAEMLTILAAVAPHLFEAPPEGRKVRWREINTEGDLWKTLKLRPEQVTASMYRNHGPVGGPDGPKPLSAEVIAAREQAEAHDTREMFQTVGSGESTEEVVFAPPAAETPVTRNEGNGYVELITRVESRPDPHYARRVIARGRVIYSATSWQLDGPWHVWERDVSAMLGLGLA